MARPIRIEYEGAIYHVTSRGNAKRDIFKDDIDRNTFIKILKQAVISYNLICHGYCLMDNHFHLILETPDGNLSKGMRHINGVYTQAYNKRHKSAGHIFQGRYKAIVIERDSYLLEVSRYVVLNPVRAGMVEKAKKWNWSSYNSTAGLKTTENWLTVDWILSQFGKREKEARKKYMEFVREGKGQGSIWEEVKGQSILGGQKFTDKLIEYLAGNKDIKEIPKKQRYLARPDLEVLFGNKDIKKKTRNELINEAIKKYGYSQKEIADYLRMHYSTISRLIEK
ncbi:MAG: transposase [bacterium]|nr:transposase [bacterium]